MKACGASQKVRTDLLCFCFVSLCFLARGAPSSGEVAEALRKAASYYGDELAVNGGYVYYYSPDLSRRLGEGVAVETEIWVQPPGTPTVGEAFLDAYDATQGSTFLYFAISAGNALLYGQLKSGGWRNSIDFDSSGPRIDEYRNGKGRGKNLSTLDDDISQSALRFLMRLDEALMFQGEEIHEAVEYSLTNLLKAQFSNGAFPQVWGGPSRGVNPPDSASFPEYDWRTEGRIKNYWDQFTLNDGLAGAMTEVLTDAHRIYKKEEYREALRKLGDFLIQAQMPEPQPAWAQQYSEEMIPIWARAFEPPAIAGRESEDAMISLLRIAEYLDDNRYLGPIVPGVKYLEKSLLPTGKLARYYELETNKPLYMERDGKQYKLTNDDSRLPSHYGWQNPSRLDMIKMAYRARLAGRSVDSVLEPREVDTDAVESIVKSLDEEGRWMSRYSGELLVGQPKFQDGEEYINSQVFHDNVKLLAAYLMQMKR